MFGIFTGATLHEVAQVIAAGKMISEPTADAAVVAKMVRVLALGPLLLVMALWPQGKAEAGQAPAGKGRFSGILKSVPWFAVGFVAVMALNSAGTVPAVIGSVSRARLASTALRALLNSRLLRPMTPATAATAPTLMRKARRSSWAIRATAPWVSGRGRR